MSQTVRDLRNEYLSAQQNYDSEVIRFSENLLTMSLKGVPPDELVNIHNGIDTATTRLEQAEEALFDSVHKLLQNSTFYTDELRYMLTKGVYTSPSIKALMIDFILRMV